MDTPVILYLDLETLSMITPFISPEGRSLEITLDDGLFKESHFHRYGVWIRQMAVGYFDENGGLQTKSWNIKTAYGQWSKEAIEYAKEKGFYELKETLDFQTAWESFCAFLPKDARTVIIVAYNGDNFDARVLEIHLKRFELSFPHGLEVKLFDPIYYTRELKKDPKLYKMTNLKLETIYELFMGTPLPNAHTALGDVLAMIHVFPKIMGSKQEWEEFVIKSAKPWKPLITASLYDIRYTANGVVSKLSLGAIKLLEEQGYYTKASLMLSHSKGVDIKQLLKDGSKEDAETLYKYMEWSISKLKKVNSNPAQKSRTHLTKSERPAPPLDVPRPSATVVNETKAVVTAPALAAVPPAPVVANKKDPNMVVTDKLILGLAKNTLARLKKHLNKDTLFVSDLYALGNTEEEFMKGLGKIVPQLNNQNRRLIWKWLSE